ANIVRVPDTRILLAAMCYAPQDAQERGWPGKQHMIPGSVIKESWPGLVRYCQQLVTRYKAYDKIHCFRQLRRIVALGQLGNVEGNRLAVSGKSPAPLLLGLCGGRALE